MRYSSAVSMLERTWIMATLLALAACEKNSSEMDSSRDAGTAAPEGGLWSAPLPSNFPPWPPQYFFWFVGFETYYAVQGVYSDDRYVYWGERGGFFKRVQKSGRAAAESFVQCTVCSQISALSTGEYFYSLAGQTVMRFDSSNANSTEIPL